ncbi:MAG TPA: PAS domain-containing protein, partial [Candidatus Omnitrophota bacterium]|nr:PAS domain-containing protein [Candidatus Omnitrophota bacterium]
ERGYRKISMAIALLSVCAGLLVTAGWFLDIGALKSVFPEMVAMKFNTALAFLLTGIALYATAHSIRDGSRAGGIALVSSLAISAIGLLTIIEYSAGVNIGIDQLLFREPEGAALTTHLGRMAFLTAVNFLLLGVALSLIGSRSDRGAYAAQMISAATGLFAYQNLTGYIFGVKVLHILHHNFTVMALHTAALFLLLSIGVIFASGNKGFMRIMCSDLSAGIMLRRILPFALILPPVFGWLKLTSERAGVIPHEFGVSLIVFFNAAVFCILVVVSAKELLRTEEKRIKAEEDINKAAKDWSATFDAITDFIFVVDKDSRIVRANKVFTDFLKMKPEDIVGERCFRIVHGAEKPWPGCPHQRTLADRKTHTEEVFDPRIGLPLLVSTSPIYDDKGEFIGSVHIAKDVSALKKAQQELHDKISDMEKFHKVAVDRELKMIELKGRIKELEGKLKA